MDNQKNFSKNEHPPYADSTDVLLTLQPNLPLSSLYEPVPCEKGYILASSLQHYLHRRDQTGKYIWS